MITGATRGGGGRKLANHLADVKGHNVQTILGATRGLGATEIRAALRELDAGATGGNTDRHAYHLHMDPGPAEVWTDDTRREAWARLEAEMGLVDAPFVEVRHLTWRTLEPEDDLERVRAVHGAEAMREKDGRHQVLMAHEHRVYDLTRDNGSVIDIAHDFARREKVGRVFEHDHGFDLVPGRHNRAVAARLDDERPDVAAAIRGAGLTDGPRPQASVSPRARAQAERTGIDPRTVGAAVLAAWAASDGGAAFAAALREQGFILAIGNKAAVVVDGAGGVHPLARMLGKESKIAGDRITAADVSARLSGLDLPRHDPAAGAPAPPAPAPPPGKQAPSPAATQAVGNPGAGGPARKLTITTGSKTDDDAVKIGIEFGESVRAAFDEALGRAAARDERADVAAAEAVVDRGPARDRGDGREGRPVDAQGDRPTGVGTGPVRGDPGGDRGGQPVALAEHAGAAGEGDLAAQPSGDPPRSDRREPSQAGAQAGRDRVQARRTAAGLAAAVQGRGTRLAELTHLVASPPTVASVQTDRARAAMAVSRERVAAVLATAPWSDPADRRAGPLQDAGRDRVQSAMDARAAAATAAVERAEQLRSRVGIMARVLAVIGLETPAMRAAADAAREARQAEQAAKTSRLDFREDLAQADRSGTAEASRRQRDQDRWEDKPDVRAARREEEGNRMVVAAVKAGDPEIKEILKQEDGLRIAREELLRRETEHFATEQLARREHKDRQSADPTVSHATAAAPKPGRPGH